MGDVTPKLPSASALSHTPGYEPSLVATTQPVVQPGGRTVTPGVRMPGLLSYTDPLTSRFPGWKYVPPGPCADAPALVAAIKELPVSTVSASSNGARHRERRGAVRCGRIMSRTSSARPAPCGPGKDLPCSAGKAIPPQPGKPAMNIPVVCKGGPLSETASRWVHRQAEDAPNRPLALAG